MSTTMLLVGSLSVLMGMVTLVVALRILRSALRSERRGNERLEILREQQARLEFLREERMLLLEQLRQEHNRRTEVERAWEESLAQENGRVPLPAVRGALEAAPRLPWWRRLLGT